MCEGVAEEAQRLDMKATSSARSRTAILAVKSDLKGFFKGDIDIAVDVEVDVDTDSYVGCLVQVLFTGTEAIMVQPLIIPK